MSDEYQISTENKHHFFYTVVKDKINVVELCSYMLGKIYSPSSKDTDKTIPDMSKQAELIFRQFSTEGNKSAFSLALEDKNLDLLRLFLKTLRFRNYAELKKYYA